MADDDAAVNAVDKAARLSSDRSSLKQFRTEPTASRLLLAEDQLLYAAASGKDCTLGDGVRPDTRDPLRCVRASFLRFLALGGDDSVKVDEQGVVLNGAYVEDPLDLTGAHCKRALRLTNCFFSGEIVLAYAEIPLIMLDGSRVPGITGDLVHVSGSVFLQDGFLSEGPVRFYGGRIDGNLDCRGATFELNHEPATKDRRVLICSNARIGGDLNLSKNSGREFLAKGQVRLISAKIGGELNADGAHFENPNQTAFLANSASVGGDVTLRGARIAGKLELQSAKIGGRLNADGAHFENSKETVFLAKSASVGGDMTLSGVRVAGQLELQGASIGGALTLTSAGGNTVEPVSFGPGDIAGPDLWPDDGADTLRDADAKGRIVLSRRAIRPTERPEEANSEVGLLGLLAQDIDVKGSLTLIGQFLGSVSVYGGRIGGDLDCRGCLIDGRDSDALICANANIGGTVLLSSLPGHHQEGKFGLASSDLFEARGLVNFASATIGGDLNCTGGLFVNASGVALDCSSSRIGGSAYLGPMWFSDPGRPNSRLEATFSGTVNFYGANIGRDLDCSGGDFHTPGSDALNCAAVQVGGSVFLTRFVTRPIDGRLIVIQLSDAFRSTGTVSLQGATIGLDLNCTGGRFENPGGLALDVSNAKIKGNAIFGCWFLDAENVAFRFASQGTVSLWSTEIGGSLSCAGGSFLHPDGVALNCSAIKVGGAVFLTKPDLPDSASAGSATSSQGVVAPPPFQSEGLVDFKFAEISLVLLCQGGRFRNCAPDKMTPSQAALALDLRSARMDSLQLGVALPGSTPAMIEGSIDLTGAHAIQLIDDGFAGDAGCFPEAVTRTPAEGRSGQPLACVMTLDGFTYERLGWNSPFDATTRKKWLNRQPRQHLSEKTFRPQPFDQLARVLRAMGQDDEATAVAIDKQQRKTDLFSVPERVWAVLLLVATVGCVLLAEGMISAPPERIASLLGWTGAAACLLALYFTHGLGWLGRTTMRLLAEYGHNPTRVLLLALLLGGGLSLVFRQAAEQDVFRPIIPPGEALPDGCGGDWTKCDARPFPPIVYSFDTMLPLKLGQADKWSFERKPFSFFVLGWEIIRFPGWALQWAIWGEILFGWVASGIILALVAGMLKKD